MKNSFFLWAMLAPITLLFTSCKPAEPHVHAPEINMDSVRMQITALEDGFAAASNAGDVDGVAKYYANDAESMAPGEATRVGMDAIKAGIKKDMDEDTTGAIISFETTGVWAGGNYATETGKVILKDSTGTVIHNGKYMTLFELRDGKYIAIRDIWNSDPKPK